MKFLLAAFLFMANYCYSQSSNDSLRKYSYFIVGFKDVGGGTLSTGSGTGYFIEKNKKLFFVTAKHVICPCDFRDTCKAAIKREIYPDVMTVYLTNNGIFNYAFMPIEIKTYRDTCKCSWPPIHPDLIAYEVTGKNPSLVYCINDLMATEFPKKRGNISIHGYPANEFIVQGSFVERNSSNLLLYDYKLYENYRYKNCEGLYSIDKQDYIVVAKELILDTLFGYSGSPVFIFNKKSKKWVFIGTFIATVENGKMQIIKPSFTLSVIDNPIYTR